MTYKRIIGFESDTTILTGESCTYTGTPTVSTTQKHQTTTGYGGSRSILCSGTAAIQMNGPAGAAGDEIHVALYSDSTGGGPQAMIQFQDSANANQAAVTIQADGFVRIRRGSGVTGTIIATSAATLAQNTWNTLLIKVTLREAASGGRIQVFANGSTSAIVDTGAGVDCRQTSNDDFLNVELRQQGGGGPFCYWDDFVWATSGTLPDEALYIKLLRPTSDVVSDGTPSTGTDNFAVVDEDPVSTADYNELTVAGNEDSFGLGNLGAVPSSILCVKAHAHATGQGTITNGRTLITSNGTTSYGTNQTLSTGGTYAAIYDHFPLNPDGNVAWDQTAIDALVAGYEANS